MKRKSHFLALMHAFNSLLHTYARPIKLALSRFDDGAQVCSPVQLDSSRVCTISLVLVHNKVPMKCRLNHTFYLLAFAHIYRLCKCDSDSCALLFVHVSMPT